MLTKFTRNDKSSQDIFQFNTIVTKAEINDF